MTEFTQLVEERRSASNFLADTPITKNELNDIFSLVKLGPSAFNLQHTKYITVMEPELKEKIRTAAYGQYKVSSASAVVIVLGDKGAFKQASQIYEGLKMLGIVNKQEYDQMVEDTVSFYESRGREFQRDEAIRNASLSAMLFMLAAKEKGWDTCPMIGFDPKAVRELLNIHDEDEPVLMITIGKEKTESRKPRGYRKPVSEFVTYY
ncbi:nitroreductase family protein [Domibacillus sp. DTU_2020_1001157_1_SI_ALB_TIR_016]|uniref:nitroreductase family protein n=1 Tax=Domibacillus sp. DTU_2020_1001157_1_SI_ALB_TIR_016 TaxID=3077789 RepID=UPI0028EAF020|nr:nitroreductase family protein [Domibacillus sp. DTU_2020_1001157_1_SI_ALB_TIR_016]WNS78079.1 nitroreductase family protein [Domibacillus sp. DTU_2020_1001157_1_SI_ALB_TIR_016]